MNNADVQYFDLLDLIRHEGDYRMDRTGTGATSIFGHQMRFDLAEGFPLLTTKRVHFPSIVAELLWFLSGSTNANDLRAMGCTIWDEWAAEDGELGPVYGHQWRSWETFRRFALGYGHGEPIDQIAGVIASLKADPYGRRHIVSAWNPADLGDMALPPCHCLFQFFVSRGRLSCQLYQRSADVFLGLPFNIASYALLTHLIAREVGLGVGEFVHTLGDAHLYANHAEQAKEQRNRAPRDLPTLALVEEAPGIFELTPDHFMLRGYDPHPSIKAPVAV